MSYPWGILGHNGELKPRYGLWLDTSEQCQRTVKKLITEGYTFDVVLKWACSPRERVDIREYLRRHENGELAKVDADWIREVFIADPETR